MRGATPYGLRGTALAIPDGTLDNPSVRFGRERSGLYRAGDGVVGLGVKKFKALEATGPTTSLFSNGLGTNSITPLALVRANASEADGLETRLDICEIEPSLAIARMAIYRQDDTPFKYGFKWYGFSSSLHATPAMTLTGDKWLGLGTADPQAGLHLTDPDVYLTPAAGVLPAAAPTRAIWLTDAHNSADLTSYLALMHNGASAAGLGNARDASIYTSGGSAGRLLLGSHGAARLILSSAAGVQFMNGAQELARVTTGGAVGLGVTVPNRRLHVTSVAPNEGIMISSATAGGTESPALVMANHSTLTSANRVAYVGLTLAGGHLLDGLAGDLVLATYAANAGRVLLGSRQTTQLILDTTVGIRFMNGATDQMRLNTTGNLGIRTTTPERTLVVATTGTTDGIYMGAVGDYQQGNSASYTSATQRLILALVVGGGSAHIGAVGDACLYTGGNDPKRLILGSYGTAQLILDATVGIRFMHGAAEYMRMTTGGYLGIRTSAPTWPLHVVNSGNGNGVLISAPASNPNWSPTLNLSNLPLGATRSGVLGLAGSNGDFGVTAGDLVLQNSTNISNGSARLILQTAGAAARIIISYDGRVSIGPYEGGSRFNVYQPGDSHAGGLRVYHTNQSHFISMHTSTPGHIVLGVNGNGFIHVNPSVGWTTFGTSASDVSRIHCLQSGSDPTEGFRASLGGYWTRKWLDANGWARWDVNGNYGVALLQGASYFCPPIDQATNLGHPSYRWVHLYCVGATFAGAITAAGYSGGNISGGAGTFSGNISAAAGTFSSNVSVAGNLSGGGIVLTGRVVQNVLDISPQLDNQGSCGVIGRMWSHVSTYNAWKPGGGLWSDSASDARAKIKSAERPYERGLADILQLRPIWYRFNGLYGTPKDAEFAGFMAEEVREVVPEMVLTVMASREPGDEEEEILTLNTSNLQLMLLNAIKELHERLTALEGRAA